MIGADDYSPGCEMDAREIHRILAHRLCPWHDHPLGEAVTLAYPPGDHPKAKNFFYCPQRRWYYLVYGVDGQGPWLGTLPAERAWGLGMSLARGEP